MSNLKFGTNIRIENLLLEAISADDAEINNPEHSIKDRCKLSLED